MTLDEIKANAPKGATHYDDSGNYYYKDGWFRYIYKDLDWSIEDMCTDMSKLNKINDNLIKENKPCGATHYNPNGEKAVYYKIDNGELKFYVHKHDLWYGSCMKLDELKPL